MARLFHITAAVALLSFIVAIRGEDDECPGLFEDFKLLFLQFANFQCAQKSSPTLLQKCQPKKRPI